MPSLLTEPPRPAVVRESPHAHWYVVATVCIGAFMGQLDASIVTIALPRIGHDLHASVGAVEWVAVGGALYTAGGRLPLSMAALGATSLLVGAALHLHDSRE